MYVIESPSSSGAADTAGLVSPGSSGDVSLRNSRLIWKKRQKTFTIIINNQDICPPGLTGPPPPTCMRAVGLSRASCRLITPNKGSGAPSVSSIRDRASGRTAAFLPDKIRILSQENERLTRLVVLLHTCRDQSDHFSRSYSVSEAGSRQTEVPLKKTHRH